MNIRLLAFIAILLFFITPAVLATDIINQGTSVYIQESSLNIVRGGSFTITIIGRPSTNYYLGIVNPSTNDNPPMIDDNQLGVVFDNGTTHWYSNVTTGDDGSRVVRIVTNHSTKNQKYRIIAKNVNNSDEVEVTVIKGVVTIGTGGDTFLGETIKFIGTNTETSEVYLFITGANLPTDGAIINSLNPRNNPAIGGNLSSFQKVDVMSDKTWSWDWPTSNMALDEGVYTVYASNELHNMTNLYNDTYNSVSINLKKSFISVFSSKSEVTQGDNFVINGIAGGDPSAGIQIWVFGINYMTHDIVSVNKDGTFSYEIGRDITKDMNPGEYFAIAQHPMQNNIFDIYIDNDTVWNKQMGNGTSLFKITGSGSLQGIDAAVALVNALNSQNIDDLYTKFSFIINTPSPISVGEPTTITDMNVTSSNTNQNVTFLMTTIQPTSVPTQVPTLVPTPTPAPTRKLPGFGAIFAIIGLIVLSFVIMRRK